MAEIIAFTEKNASFAEKELFFSRQSVIILPEAKNSLNGGKNERIAKEIF